jgi:hypothetical protein
LCRDQEVIGADRRFRPFKRRAEFAGYRGVRFIDWEDGEAAGQEHPQPFGVFAAAFTAGHTIPDFVEYDG